MRSGHCRMLDLGCPESVILGVHYGRIPRGPAKPRSQRIGRLCPTLKSIPSIRGRLRVWWLTRRLIPRTQNCLLQFLLEGIYAPKAPAFMPGALRRAHLSAGGPLRPQNYSEKWPLRLILRISTKGLLRPCLPSASS